MSEPGDVKPWFREDISKVLMGINTTSRVSRPAAADMDMFREGFVVALASVGLVFGVKLETFLLPEDVETVKRLMHSTTRHPY
jgi:hypothetical protein